MALKLLTVTALFATAAMAASPPVDTRRVTGNVSTAHQPRSDETKASVSMQRPGDPVMRPPIDTCRVTGNILTATTKGGRAISCQFASVALDLDVVQRKDDQCFADGVVIVGVDNGRSCQIETPAGAVLIPMGQSEKVETPTEDEAPKDPTSIQDS